MHKRAILSSTKPLGELTSQLSIRFDPSVNRAIDFGLAEGLFSLDKNKNVELTEKGRQFARKLDLNEDIFSDEKNFLRQFKKNDFSESVVDQLIRG